MQVSTIIDKKQTQNKFGRKTQFSNLNTLTNTNKEKEEAITKYLFLFFIYGYAQRRKPPYFLVCR